MFEAKIAQVFRFNQGLSCNFNFRNVTDRDNWFYEDIGNFFVGNIKTSRYLCRQF